MHPLEFVFAWQRAYYLILLDYFVGMQKGFSSAPVLRRHDPTFGSTFKAALTALERGVGAQSFLWYGQRYYVGTQAQALRARRRGSGDGG